MPKESEDKESEDMDDVLLAFSEARAAAPGDKALLRSWTVRYPELAGDLIAADYARLMAGMTLSDALEDGPEDAAVAALGREVIAARRKASRPPLTSLVSDAAAQGLDVPALASALRLDRLLLGRLEQRLLDAATLPLALIQQMAQLLDRAPGEVAAYLRGSPRLAAQAHFRARRTPSLPLSEAERASFVQALQSGQDMSGEDRAYWQGEIDAGVLGADFFKDNFSG